jgi:hypothetical protein
VSDVAILYNKDKARMDVQFPDIGNIDKEQDINGVNKALKEPEEIARDTKKETIAVSEIDTSDTMSSSNDPMSHIAPRLDKKLTDVSETSYESTSVSSHKSRSKTKLEEEQEKRNYLTRFGSILPILRSRQISLLIDITSPREVRKHSLRAIRMEFERVKGIVDRQNTIHLLFVLMDGRMQLIATLKVTTTLSGNCMKSTSKAQVHLHQRLD